jgi:hypothetical protein
LLTDIIPAVGRPKQGEYKFKDSLGYIVRPCHRKTKTKPKKFLNT